MRLHHYFEDISLSPYKKELAGYSLSTLYQDLMAAISVALLTLPQAMGFAVVLGLPLSTSLFAAIFSCIITAFFGSSRHLVAGPSNPIAILIQFGTAEILYNYFRELTGVDRELMAMQIMGQLTLIVAFLHFMVVGLKMGRLTQFVSYSVILGYVAGASIAIIVNQIFVIAGIVPQEGIDTIFAKGIYLLGHLYQFHWLTLLIGGGTLLLILFLRRWDKRIPAALIAMVLTTTLLYAARWFELGAAFNVAVILDIGDLTSLVPQLAIPSFNFKILNELIPTAFAVALLSILETSAVAKSISSYTGQRLSINQEIFGLGLGNLTSALCGAMPVSGSTSRTFLNFESGAQTRLAAIFGAGFVGLILYLFGGLVAQIPLATLAALIIFTAGTLVKKKQLLLCLKSTRSDAIVFWITMLSCIFFSIDIAFYIGVCLSVTLYLNKSAVPQVQQYIVEPSGRTKSLEFCTDEELTKIRFIKVKGELFFGAADLFQTTLKSIAEDDTNTRVIILQLKNARDIDATACLALQQLYDYVSSSGRHLIISGITLPIWEVMSDSGLVEAIGKENLFLIDDRNPNLYFQRAIQWANELIAREEVPAVKEEGKKEVSLLETIPVSTSI